MTEPGPDDGFVVGQSTAAETESETESETEFETEFETDRVEQSSTAVEQAALPPARSSLRLSIAIAVVVVALDQITKHWAINALADGAARHVIWTLQWNLSFNSGMAFSRGQGIGPIIGILAFVVVVVMLVSLRKSGSRLAAVAVGLVVGGALGNIADRLFRGSGWLHGSVVDFIDFQWVPIFNVADSAINIGGALLVLSALFDAKARSR